MIAIAIVKSKLNVLMFNKKLCTFVKFRNVKGYRMSLSLWLPQISMSEVDECDG